MRLSLLQHREPIGHIVAATLSRFWTQHYGHNVTVLWHNRRPPCGSAQVWYCNPYLNAIFVRGADWRVFDVVRREFSHSLMRWRRPLQKAYVALAAGSSIAPLFARGWLTVAPAISDAADQLVVPGNHKLRILNARTSRVFAILKDGFDPAFIHNEIEARQLAIELDIATPMLLHVGDDKTWFCEEFACGTPINRLSDAASVQQAVREVSDQLGRLAQHTARDERIDSYVGQLTLRITDAIRTNHRLANSQRRTLQDGVTHLEKRILVGAGPRDTITTSRAHGDFQPANILVAGDRPWLIDWEYSQRRQIGYDAIVYRLRSRAPAGVAQRLSDWMDSATLPTGTVRVPPRHRARSADLFVLEELDLGLRENANVCFSGVGDGLLTWMRELQHWRDATENTAKSPTSQDY